MHWCLVWRAGTIPPELEGTLLRNGPALFDVGGAPVNQPFDGDGMVRSWPPPLHAQQVLSGSMRLN